MWAWEDQPSFQDPDPLEDAAAVAVAAADQTVVVEAAKDAVAGAAAVVSVDEVAVGAAGATVVRWVVLAVVVGAASLE